MSGNLNGFFRVFSRCLAKKRGINQAGSYYLCLGVVLLISGLVWSQSAAADENNSETTLTTESEPNTLKAPADYTLAVIRVKDYYTEKPGITTLSLAGSTSTSISDLTGAINKSAEDKTVDAVLLAIEEPFLSWAQVDELRQAIGRTRQTGKKIYAYAETLGQLDYLAASACDQIIISPTGEVMMMGLAGRAVYLRNLLDKLGIQADLMQVGKFKSAAEAFTRSEPSPEELDQVNNIFDSLYDYLLETIAEGRNLSIPQVRRLLDEGPFTAGEARSAGLVDELMYRDEFLKHLKDQTGRSVRLKTDYEKKRKIELQFNSPLGFMGLLQGLMYGPPEPAGDAIAVVYIDGAIASGESNEDFGSNMVGSQTIRKALSELENDKEVKAIVVRIDSPGGSAIASDVIYHALRKASQAKPVVASMGSVAASGGYYVACGASTIVAQPSTITGSIGVVGGKLVTAGLWEKLGITSYGFTRGKNAEIYSSLRPFTALERLKITVAMEEIYETFKKSVMETRGSHLKYPIESLAQGKIYTGGQAHKLGLIDQTGGLDDAIKLAAETANIEKYNIRVRPLPKSLIEILEEMFSQADNPQPYAAGMIAAKLGKSLLPGWAGWAAAQNTRQNYSVLKLLQQGGNLAKLLQKEPILMVQPYEIIYINSN